MRLGLVWGYGNAFGVESGPQCWGGEGGPPPLQAIPCHAPPPFSRCQGSSTFPGVVLPYEQEVLDQLQAATSGDVLWMLGDSYSGKSNIINLFRQRQESHGHLVIQGTCGELDRRRAFCMWWKVLHNLMAMGRPQLEASLHAANLFDCAAVLNPFLDIDFPKTPAFLELSLEQRTEVTQRVILQWLGDVVEKASGGEGENKLAYLLLEKVCCSLLPHVRGPHAR